MVIISIVISGASKDKSSRIFPKSYVTFSLQYYPYFDSLQMQLLQFLRIASSENSIFIPSVSNNAIYCFNNALSGSQVFEQNLQLVIYSSSTRIGKRPCNSGIKSEGFAI